MHGKTVTSEPGTPRGAARPARIARLVAIASLLAAIGACDGCLCAPERIGEPSELTSEGTGAEAPPAPGATQRHLTPVEMLQTPEGSAALAEPELYDPGPDCGDGTRDPREFCDGDDFDGATCGDFGYPSGSLRCRSNCTIDLTGCRGEAACGNGIKEEDEQCDGLDIGTASCTSVGFQSGRLACLPDCTYDTSSCSNDPPPRCGDGEINQPTEQCDTEDLGEQTCEMLGHSGGTLGCTEDCTLDLRDCNVAAVQPRECQCGERGGRLEVSGPCPRAAQSCRWFQRLAVEHNIPSEGPFEDGMSLCEGECCTTLWCPPADE